jgi:hypothetical protein
VKRKLPLAGLACAVRLSTDATPSITLATAAATATPAISVLSAAGFAADGAPISRAMRTEFAGSRATERPGKQVPRHAALHESNKECVNCQHRPAAGGSGKAIPPVTGLFAVHSNVAQGENRPE